MDYAAGVGVEQKRTVFERTLRQLVVERPHHSFHVIRLTMILVIFQGH